MVKQLLDVGNCGPDFFHLQDYLQQHFEVQVEQAHSIPEALQKLRQQDFDLVTVNRILDRDGTYGIELIRTMQRDPQLAQVPVMLISNYPEYQQQACELGAIAGFGKSSLQTSETLEKLQPYLGTDESR